MPFLLAQVLGGLHGDDAAGVVGPGGLRAGGQGDVVGVAVQAARVGTAGLQAWDDLVGFVLNLAVGVDHDAAARGVVAVADLSDVEGRLVHLAQVLGGLAEVGVVALVAVAVVLVDAGLERLGVETLGLGHLLDGVALEHGAAGDEVLDLLAHAHHGVARRGEGEDHAVGALFLPGGQVALSEDGECLVLVALSKADAGEVGDPAVLVDPALAVAVNPEGRLHGGAVVHVGPHGAVEARAAPHHGAQALGHVGAGVAGHLDAVGVVAGHALR